MGTRAAVLASHAAAEEVRRRAYLIGLSIGIVVVPLIWALQRSENEFVRVAYPVLGAFVGAAFWALWTRRVAVRTAERVVLVFLAALYLSRLAILLHGSADLSEVREELAEPTLWNINLLYSLAYLAFDTRTGLRVALAIYAAFATIAATRLVPPALRGEQLAEGLTLLRVGAFMGAGIAILYGLAHVKEHLADARAQLRTMQLLATTDPLTGVANRRALYAAMETRITDAERYGRPTAVVLLDVDSFKALNDTHGHDAGDRALRHLVAAVQSRLRGPDLLGRWGGEEFLIVAPETDAAQAAHLAEACRRMLASEPFEEVGPVTASFGVAQWAEGDTMEDLVRRADVALYEAKHAGRNRVHAAEKVPS